MRRAALVNSIAQVKDLSDQLKRLISDPELPVSGSLLVLPETLPPLSAVVFDPQDQINQALEHRLELAEQILRIDSSSLVTRVAKNNLLPSLQIVSTLTSNGASANWDQANENSFDFNYMTYRFGMQFEVPLGNRQAQAIYQRTLLQRQQSIDAYRSLVDQTSLDVYASTSCRGNRMEFCVTRITWRFWQPRDTLDAITTRERGEEALTPSFVQLKLDTQLRWADAARSEAQATANYALAITALERAKGTLLRYDNVVMEEDRLDAIHRGNVLANIPKYKPITVTTTQPADSSR